MIKKLICVFFILLGAARAEDIYVAQTAQGAGNGTSAGNAYAQTFFNTSGNWANPKVSGKIGPDDTVHLVGVITSNLLFQLGGNLNHPITLLFEPGAKCSQPYSDVAVHGGLIDIFQHDNITINGDITGGRQGIIECTANGTNLANSVSTVGINAQSCSQLLIKNLTIQNMYVRVAGTDTSPGTGSTAISDADSNGLGLSNYHVTNVTITNGGFNGINGSVGAGNANWEFDHCDISNCNWCIGTGDRGSGSRLDTIKVHDNNLHDWISWNETGSDAFHHNGWHIFAVNGGIFSHIFFYNNTVGPGWGGIYQTGGDFYEGDLVDIHTYNNLYKASPGEAAGNGFITLGSVSGTATPTTHYMLNNTFIGGAAGTCIQTGAGTTPITLVIQNNIGSGGGNGIFVAIYNNANATVQADYNWGFNFESQPYINSPNGNGAFYDFAGWKGFGYDLHGAYGTDPLFVSNTDFHLQAGSPAIGTGADWSSQFTTDKDGNTRTRPWTPGCYTPNAGFFAAVTVSGKVTFSNVILH